MCTHLSKATAQIANQFDLTVDQVDFKIFISPIVNGISIRPYLLMVLNCVSRISRFFKQGMFPMTLNLCLHRF